jgi:hypothetical protein
MRQMLFLPRISIKSLGGVSKAFAPAVSNEIDKLSNRKGNFHAAARLFEDGGLDSGSEDGSTNA